MATFILKRKQFGFLDTAKDVTGGALEGTGKALDNGLTKTAAGIGGFMAAPAIGAEIGGLLGGPVGALVGAGLTANPIGAAAVGAGAAGLTGAAGKILKGTGRSLQD